jgi:chitodextrinase
VTSSSFTANWSSVSGASSYLLDVSSNSAFTSYVSGYQSLSVGNVLSRGVTGLSANTIYYYRVRATNTNGTSGNSNMMSVTTSAAADTTAPTVPAGLTATAASSSQINLSWSAATDSGGSGLAGYRVYQSGSQVASTASTGYDRSGLSANIQYCFTVAAYDNAGNVSGQSVQACATTQSVSTGTGSYVWSKNFGGALATDNVTLTSNGVDSSGNIIVTGYFQGNVDFGGGTVSSVGGQDIFVAKYSSTGGYLWSKTMGSVAGDYAMALYVDRNDNIIVTGSFNYSVDFGGGALNSASPGFSDIFLVKYSAAGVHQWSKQFGDTGNDTGYDVTADATGNVIVTGSFVGSVDFGGGRLTSNSGSNDIFVAKYSATGGYSWSRVYGGIGDDHGNAVATDANGNVVITGYFNNTIDFGGGPLTSAGNKEIFLVELNSSGQHVWSKRFGGTSIEVANAVAIDAGGNIIITGFFYGTVDFGGGPLTSSSAAKVFLAKYNSQGNHTWSKVFSGTVVADNAIALGLAIDSNSNILVTGYFNGSANFGGQTFTSAGSDDVFAAKYSAAGTHTWSQRFGGPALDQGKAIVADAGNNMILSGSFNYAVSFGGPTLTNLNGSDFYLVKFTP